MVDFSTDNLAFCLNYIERRGNSSETETYFPATLIFVNLLFLLPNKDLWGSGARVVNHCKA